MVIALYLVSGYWLIRAIMYSLDGDPASFQRALIIGLLFVIMGHLHDWRGD